MPYVATSICILILLSLPAGVASFLYMLLRTINVRIEPIVTYAITLVLLIAMALFVNHNLFDWLSHLGLASAKLYFIPLHVLVATLFGILVYVTNMILARHTYLSSRLCKLCISVDMLRSMNFWIILLIAALEELVFRALLIGLFNDLYNNYMFSLVACTIFYALNHLIYTPKIALFKLFDGAIYTIALVLTGTIITPMIAHITYNLMTLLIRYKCGGSS